MFLKIPLLVFVYLLFFSGLSTLAQENYIVRSISFEGNKILTAENLFEQMEHYQTSWFADVILFEDPYLFSSEIFERDKERIIKYYQKESFIYAKIINVNLIKDDNSKTVEIIIKIDESTPIIVGIADINTGNNKLQQIPKIAEELSLKKGVRFRDNLITSDKNLIINFFINNGFPYVTADYSLDLDTLNNVVNIFWNVAPGKLSKFGDVEFEGNERTEKKLLENKLSFQKGQAYDGTELDKTQKKIYALGLFHIVSVKALFEKEELSIIPIKINLVETPKFNTKLGIGYGRDEKFRVSIDQRWLGFLGGARQLKFYAKHSDLEPYHFRFDYIQPDFITEYTNLSISPYLIKQTEPAFSLNKFGADLKLQRPLLKNVIGSFKYTFERSNLDTNSISSEELKFYNLESVYNKSGIEVGFERNTSEPVFDPNSGSLSSVVVHYSGLGLQSKYHFLRPTIEYRKYNRISEWLILAFRIKAGTIFSYDEDEFVPYEDRFYSGGSSSLRGWARAELGPKDSDGQPLGGKSVFESNIEFRYPIYSLLSGVVFLDYGNVWTNELTYNFNELRYSAGWGLRISTPIGPVRIDLAIPVFEGAAKLQYFISVGQAF